MSTTAKSAIRATLAANMRRMRKERQLTQEALADKAGIHRNYLGGIEREERNVGLDNLDRIARALGVSVSTLLAAD